MVARLRVQWKGVYRAFLAWHIIQLYYPSVPSDCAAGNYIEMWNMASVLDTDEQHRKIDRQK